jgi:hypothetical protein
MNDDKITRKEEKELEKLKRIKFYPWIKLIDGEREGNV